MRRSVVGTERAAPACGLHGGQRNLPAGHPELEDTDETGRGPESDVYACCAVRRDTASFIELSSRRGDSWPRGGRRTSGVPRITVAGNPQLSAERGVGLQIRIHGGKALPSLHVPRDVERYEGQVGSRGRTGDRRDESE